MEDGSVPKAPDVRCTEVSAIRERARGPFGAAADTRRTRDVAWQAGLETRDARHQRGTSRADAAERVRVAKEPLRHNRTPTK